MNMKLECDLSGIRKCMMSGLSLLLAGVLQAQNPIVQTCYTSDPAPMVHDGTLYVYTGHDEDHADFFWMQEWRVYSTKDMVNWTDHGSPLAIESFDWATIVPGHRNVSNATGNSIGMCVCIPS
jgi:Glycosyl hydrolases family 43.